MISTARLVAWAHAEGVTAEEATLREVERAAVDYVNRMSGRYFGATATITEEFRWRGGVIQLSNTPLLDEEDASTLVLSSWDGSAWSAYSASDYFVTGRLVYLAAGYMGDGTHVRATYTAGYEPDAGDPNVWDAPQVVQQAVRMLAAHWFVNREGAVVGVTSSEVALAVRDLLRSIE